MVSPSSSAFCVHIRTTCSILVVLPVEESIESKRPLGVGTKDDSMGDVARYETYLAARKFSKSRCTGQHGCHTSVVLTRRTKFGGCLISEAVPRPRGKEGVREGVCV